MHISKPIGLHRAVQAIEELCAESIPYENRRVDPLLLELEAGNGQTVFARYAAQMLTRHKVRQIVGLTTYLEYTVDTRMEQLQQMFGDIASAAKGVNHFEGVIALDVTALSQCVHEEQTRYFLENLQQIARHAVVILYLSPSGIKNAYGYQELKRKLHTALPTLQAVEVSPYTPGELSRMVLEKLDEMGVELLDGGLFARKLEQVVTEKGLTSPRDTQAIADALAKQAYEDRFSSFLEVGCLERAFPEICRKGVVA